MTQTSHQTQTFVQTTQLLPQALVQRCACGGVAGQTGECAACRQKREGRAGTLQRQSAGPESVSSGIPTTVHDVLSSPGQPLDSRTRAFMEPRFGHDFSGVRIHSDPAAAASAKMVQAHAYTVGQHVVFGMGEYRPHTTDGQRLMAHELTHVVQQNGQHAGSNLNGPTAEAQAEAAGAQISSGKTIPLIGQTAPGLQRAPFKSVPSANEVAGEHKTDLEHLKNRLLQLLQAQPPKVQAEIDARRTIAVALVEEIDAQGEGFMTVVYTASGNWNKALLERTADKLEIARLGGPGGVDPRETGSRIDTEAAQDAEQLLLEGAEQQGFRILGMVVSRKICEHCSEAISEANVKATWLDPAARKAGLGAGRLYKRGNSDVKHALTELHQAFDPQATSNQQQSSGTVPPDSPLWSALDALGIKELYGLLELAQRSGMLDTLIKAAPKANSVDVSRLYTVMMALNYREEALRASPDGLRLLGYGSKLISGLEQLPGDQREYLQRRIQPGRRNLVKPRPVPPTQQPSPQNTSPRESKEQATSSSSGLGSIVRKALTAAGVVLTGLVLIEVVEAIVSALFLEVVLAVTANALKGTLEGTVKEVAKRELRKRVQITPQQAEKAAETIYHEIEQFTGQAARALSP